MSWTSGRSFPVKNVRAHPRKGWFPYDRGSQIADRNKVCDRLRSSAISCDQLQLCDHMETKVLRSMIETHPIIFRVLSHDSTIVCSIVGTVYVATIISLSFRGIYGGNCSL